MALELQWQPIRSFVPVSGQEGMIRSLECIGGGARSEVDQP